jgi:hypothetical protein
MHESLASKENMVAMQRTILVPPLREETLSEKLLDKGTG